MNGGIRRRDLLLTQANVVGVPEATAVVVRDGRIVAAGPEDEVRGLAERGAQRVRLDGRSVIPGIIDQHLHLNGLGERISDRIVDVAGPYASLAEMAERVAEHAALRPRDAWVSGNGWSEGFIADLADSGRGADRAALDALLPDRPVVLRHFSGHAALANGAALRAAGIDDHSPDPGGGRIVRDRTTGSATGLLLESAADLVTDLVPAPTPEERAQDLLHAMQHLNRLGVTSVTDPRVTPDGLRDYGVVRRSDRQTLRVHVLLYWGESGTTNTSVAVARGIAECGASTGLGDDWLCVLGGKLFADGVPSQRTAWVDEPYPGGEDRGALVTGGDDDEARVADLHRSISLLHRHRLGVQVHAIGDAACAAVVDGMARAQSADPWPDARHVLIHGVLLRPETIAALAGNDIGVTTNALIRYHAAPAMRPSLGDERWERGVAVRSLLDAGVRVSDSSDAPVVPADWRRALQALVTRETVESDGAPVGGDERVTPLQALQMWTSTAAYQQRAEHRKGRVASGMLADLAILEEDPLTVAPDQLHALTPVTTLVGGEVVFDRDGLF